MFRFLFPLCAFLPVFFSITGCRVLMDIPDEAESTCGNSSLEPGELCDGADIGVATCATLGLGEGILTCTPDCMLNTAACIAVDPCGDGLSDLDEDCDGTDLSGQTCESLGYHGGTLACAANCTWDLASCEAAGRCGDGIIQTAEGETCDGAALGGATCESQNYYGGTLACAANCTWDRTSCELVGRCGDGIIQTAEGETCDGANLDGATCESLNYYGGTLACAANCTWNRGSCEAAGRCGDGIIQNAEGETCDGSNLGGATCEILNYYGGTLACAANCTRNLASCEAAGRCGDGIIQSGETCDGGNLDGQTCTDLGYCGGTLSCKPNCVFLTTGCSNDMCK